MAFGPEELYTVSGCIDVVVHIMLAFDQEPEESVQDQPPLNDTKKLKYSLDWILQANIQVSHRVYALMCSRNHVLLSFQFENVYLYHVHIALVTIFVKCRNKTTFCDTLLIYEN